MKNMEPSPKLGKEPPPEFNTHIGSRGDQRKFFEKYKTGDFQPDHIDEDFESVREEVGSFYDVPAENLYFIPDDQVVRKRTKRAFSVVLLNNGNHYYIDGRMPHAVLLRVLKETHRVPYDPEETETYTSIHGFIDPDGFPDVPMIQKESEKLGKPITWFIRYVVSSPSTPPPPESPIQID
ncbi:MAG: hypothetical protein NUV81_00005 [bacterium]|nr:hypothetical protein [bacterium]